MKKIWIIFVTILVTSCVWGDDMSKVDELWQVILSSSDAATEETAVEKLWQQIAASRMQIAINVIEADGNEVDIMDYENRSAITKVLVSLSNDDQKKVTTWSPINPDNIYILFREK